VGSTEFVHRRIVAARDEGTAVVLVSTELDEVLALADRIAVMYRGKIAGELPGGSSANDVGTLMAGASVDGADRADRDHEAPGAETAEAGQAAAAAAGEAGGGA
jgi:simple sugar transport system ATP-binding protein